MSTRFVAVQWHGAVPRRIPVSPESSATASHNRAFHLRVPAGRYMPHKLGDSGKFYNCSDQGVAIACTSVAPAPLPEADGSGGAVKPPSCEWAMN
jgi:hypothetical protein